MIQATLGKTKTPKREKHTKGKSKTKINKKERSPNDEKEKQNLCRKNIVTKAALLT